MAAQSARLSVLLGHLQTAEEPPLLQRLPCAATPPPSPDDVVIVCALRTPICKAKKGGLEDTPAEDLLATALAAVLQKSKVNPADVGDVIVGSVLASNVWRANQARIAMFLAGFPDSVRPPRRSGAPTPSCFAHRSANRFLCAPSTGSARAGCRRWQTWQPP